MIPLIAAQDASELPTIRGPRFPVQAESAICSSFRLTNPEAGAAAVCAQIDRNAASAPLAIVRHKAQIILVASDFIAVCPFLLPSYPERRMRQSQGMAAATLFGSRLLLAG